MIVKISGVILLFASIASAGPSSQPHGMWFNTDDGQIMLRDFATAPYPHKSRENGYERGGVKYSADEHYRDSTIGILIPRTFKPSETINLIVHFHGHKNYVESVLDTFHLAEQVVKSGRNAILIVPQGPREVADSGFGKMEDADGFIAMVNDVVKYLHDEGKIPTTQIGKIVITAHSGGYNATSAIVERGGANAYISDVLLFDATYGGLERFADWCKGDLNRRLVTIFTAHLADENFELQTLLQKRGVRYGITMEADLTDALLSPRGVLFIHTPDLAHDDVMHKRDYYARFLRTSSLPETRK